ncbi:Exonuclease RNase T/DNA polymerase III [Trinorchestia longiramus]|nr:Exonuclease RNase T/DNA polymerase III [Trinorchestia longiramus]
MVRRYNPKCADFFHAKKPSNILEHQFKYFLVLDFEATCFDKYGKYGSYEEYTKDGPEHQEIIEFPAILLNPRTTAIEGEFHSFVRPVINPELSSFCTKLTGITQLDVVESPVFSEVLAQFNAWFDSKVGKASCLPITCGDWDLMSMLPRQCCRENLEVPPVLRQWHNVKMSYCHATQRYERTMKTMLEGLHLTPVGRPHRGIDDCRNITNIVVELLQRGVEFTFTKSVPSGGNHSA